VKRVHVALGRGLVEAGIGQQLLDLVVAGDARVRDAARVALGGKFAGPVRRVAAAGTSTST
jgi:hypothetical protein